MRDKDANKQASKSSDSYAKTIAVLQAGDRGDGSLARAEVRMRALRIDRRARRGWLGHWIAGWLDGWKGIGGMRVQWGPPIRQRTSSPALKDRTSSVSAVSDCGAAPSAGTL